MNWDGIVSLFLFCIEIILLLNVLYFSRGKKQYSAAIYVIALLAGYQFFEFLMCGIKLQQPLLPFLAFADISFLPPVGLIFILELLGKKVPPKIYLLLPTIAFIIYFITAVDKFAVVSCTVLYAALNYPGGEAYGAYYYLPILYVIILLFSGLKTEDIRLKKNIKILLSGYIFTSLPVLSAFAFHFAGNDFFLTTIESIMCKAAVVLAFCYSYVILNSEGNRKFERDNPKYIPGN